MYRVTTMFSLVLFLDEKMPEFVLVIHDGEHTEACYSPGPVKAGVSEAANLS